MTTDDFVYDFSSSTRRITSASMLENLRAFAATRDNRPFSVLEYRAWSGCAFSVSTIVKRFGSWREAQERIGIQGARGWNYPPEDLIAHLAIVWKKLERRPGVKTLKQHGHISAPTYARRWGSLKNACKQFARYQNNEITLTELLNPPPPPRTDRSPLPRKLRWQVLERDHHRCVICGKSAADGITLEVDHIIPVSAKGTDDPANLRTLCKPCNRGKGGPRKSRAGKQLQERRATPPEPAQPL